MTLNATRPDLRLRAAPLQATKRAQKQGLQYQYQEDKSRKGSLWASLPMTCATTSARALLSGSVSALEPHTWYAGKPDLRAVLSGTQSKGLAVEGPADHTVVVRVAPLAQVQVCSEARHLRFCSERRRFQDPVHRGMKQHPRGLPWTLHLNLVLRVANHRLARGSPQRKAPTRLDHQASQTMTRPRLQAN